MKKPSFTRYTDVRHFRQLVEPWLLQNEAMHCLQLGLLGGMAAGERRDGPFMAAMLVDDEPVLVALRTPPHALILSACTHRGAVSSIASEIATLPADELPAEVMGPRDVADEFARSWQSISGTQSLASDRERIYQLNSVNPVTGVAGTPVRAGPSDRALLIDWFDLFHREALPDQPFDAEETVDRWLSGASRRELWFWLLDGEPVSLAGAGNPTQHGIRLGPVFTPSNRRGNGYASALVADLSQRLLDSGRSFCTLFTDLNNPTSNHIYAEIGYRPVVDIHKYRLPKT